MESSEREIVFIGGGGHALALLDQLASTDHLLGYVAPSCDEGSEMNYLGTDDAELFIPQSALVHVAVGFPRSGSLSLRAKLIASYASRSFATIISPRAIVSPRAVIGEGSAVFSGAIVGPAKAGPHCVVNSGAIIEHGCVLGQNVFVCPGAILSGEVTVGDNSLIGAGAIIRNGVTIAPDTVIGMGAVVTHSIDAPGVYVGNPARKL